MTANDDALIRMKDVNGGHGACPALKPGRLSVRRLLGGAGALSPRPGHLHGRRRHRREERPAVQGETGSLSTSWLNHTLSAAVPIRLWRGGANVVAAEVLEAPAADGFRAEAGSFAAAVAEGPAAWSGATAAESLDIALTLDALASSARTGARVDLPRDPGEPA